MIELSVYFLVPTLCVGIPSLTLRVVFHPPADGNAAQSEEGESSSRLQDELKRTQSVGDGIPTQSVGTRN